MTNLNKSSMDKTQMSNTQMNNTTPSKNDLSTTEKVALSLNKRHKKEKLFKITGLFAVLFGFMLVVILISDITSKALPAFHQHWVKLNIDYKAGWLNIDDNVAPDSLGKELKVANYRKVLKSSIYEMFLTESGKTKSSG